MPREEIVVPSRELSYDGYFSVKDVLGIISRFLEDRDYSKIDKVNEHKQLQEGTLIEIRGFHERRINDQDLFEFDIFLTFSKIKDVELKLATETKKTNSGHFYMNFKGILLSDADDNWNSKDKEDSKKPNKLNFGFGAFIRWVSDTMVFSEQTKEIKAACKRDVDDLYSTLVEYFQAQAYRK